MRVKKRGFIKIITFAVMLFIFIGFGDWVQAEEYEDEYASLPVPTNLNVYLEDYDYAYVTFDLPESEYDDDELKYMLQYNTVDEWEDMNSYTVLSREGGTVFGLEPGETYYLRMQTWLMDEDGFQIAESEWSEIIKEKVTYDPVKNVKVTTAGLNKLKITWKEAEMPEGYKIYRADSIDGKYKLVKTVKNSWTTSWTDTELTTGKTYYYKVRMYDSWRDDGILYGEFSPVVSGTPKPPKKTLTVKPASSTSVRLIWNTSNKEIKGYQIYRSKSEDCGFKRIATIKDYEKTTYVNKNLTNGETYYYKIRAYSLVDGENVYGDFSAVKSVKVTVGVPEIKSVNLAGITKATIKYYKVSDADGYQIYRATKKNGEYKRIKTIKDVDTVSYTVTGLKNGKTYYYKIRAYKEIDGKKQYSQYSEIKKRLMNKVGYKNEPFEAKAQRIFGKNDYVDFKSEKAAKKQMKEIKIKTWDINSKGKKYTRYHYLTVHKNIAPTVQQIFKEIYNGDEKFPIKDVGGYSWRGDSSSSVHCEGLAIDINYNENAQFDGDTGKPKVGKLYKPGKNPYSIPANGDVVKAFEKYGFYWGDGFYNPDYMHFSYF